MIEVVHYDAIEYCNMYDARYNFIFEVDMNSSYGQGRDMSEYTIR